MSLQPMTRVFIGKEVGRSAILDGDTITTWLPVIVDGEILITDVNKSAIVGGTPTYSAGARSTLYVVQGLGETVTIENADGTSATVRKILTSDPIFGDKVDVYKGQSYVATVEQTITFDLTGLTPIADTEYVIRLIMKDMHEDPGQFVQEYRQVATTNVADDLAAALVNKINRHKGARFVASYTSPVITLTAKPIPECTSNLTDIDKFKRVKAAAVFYYIDDNGNWQTFVTPGGDDGEMGAGNWYQVRDAEKQELGYLGVTNQTQFPVIKPDFRTVKGQTYDTIVIEHRIPYVAPNNQGLEEAQVRTILYLAEAGGQTADILTVLNSWMGSTPKAFPAVTL